MRNRVLENWWREPFEKGWYPLASIAADWEKKTKQEARSLKNILDLPRGSKILDVGCSVGRHVIALAKLGYVVTGVDISEKYLEIARAAARRHGVSARFIRCDMRQLTFNGEFDAAINLFTSFGYFHKSSDDMKVLMGIRRALSSNGVFVIDNFNFDKVRKLFTSQSWCELGDGTLILEKRDPPDMKHSAGFARSH